MKTIEDIIRELNLKITALNMKKLKIEQENNEIKCSSYLPDFNKGKIEGMREAKKLLEDVKQLDEPQKPVVPKFVGEYLNYCMGNEWTLAEALDTDNVPIPSNMAKTVDWLFSSMNQNIFAQAWLFGYEVEKEPLYCVKIGKGYFSGWDETKVTYVIDDVPGALAQCVKYETREEAEMDAIQIGGTVEEVTEG